MFRARGVRALLEIPGASVPALSIGALDAMGGTGFYTQHERDSYSTRLRCAETSACVSSKSLPTYTQGRQREGLPADWVGATLTSSHVRPGPPTDGKFPFEIRAMHQGQQLHGSEGVARGQRWRGNDRQQLAANQMPRADEQQVDSQRNKVDDSASRSDAEGRLPQGTVEMDSARSLISPLMQFTRRTEYQTTTSGGYADVEVVNATAHGRRRWDGSGVSPNGPLQTPANTTWNPDLPLPKFPKHSVQSRR